MAKQKMKYNKEELNAMRINAMLQGIDPSTIMNEPLEEDDIDIEIEDEKPKKRKKKTEEKVVVKNPEVEMLPHFERLLINGHVNVTYNGHDIHYKEQLWGIDTRVIEYNIELVKNPKVARDCSDIVNGQSVEEREKATKGEVRYMKVTCHLENIPFRAREIAWVKVGFINGKLKYKVSINENQLKQTNINPEKLLKSVRKELDRMLA